MDLEKILASAAGYEARQARIDAALTPEKVLDLYGHLTPLHGLDLQQSVVQLVFKSTEALERAINSGTDPTPEILEVHVYDVDQMLQQRPQSRVLQDCKRKPEAWAVCIDTYLPPFAGNPPSVMTHTTSCFMARSPGPQ